MPSSATLQHMRLWPIVDALLVALAFALAMFLLALLRFVLIVGSSPRSADDFDDREIQLAARDAHFYDPRGDHVANVDAHARVSPVHRAVALVHFPVVVHQILVPDQAIDEIHVELDEDAKVGDAGNDAAE